MSSRKTLLWICGGCAAVVAAGCVIIAAVGIFWLATSPEGGVRLGNEMEEYALTYLADNQILNEGEQIVAYYDATLTLNGREAVILTDERIIYHRNDRNEFITLEDITDIQTESDTLIGDTFLIFGQPGQTMQFEIAPLNGGSTFQRVLDNTWRQSRGQ